MLSEGAAVVGGSDTDDLAEVVAQQRRGAEARGLGDLFDA
jgi:hypothetical protein